jgi:type II secretory pathway component PulF
VSRADGDRKTNGALSLERLLALNEEVAALVRAGIPLDQGLTALGEDARGEFGAVATRLAERLRGGEALADILRQDDTTFPPVWRAVVLAGIRSGHLAAALEGWATTARRTLELRRNVAISLIYPGIVVVLAYALFLFTIRFQLPVLARAQADLVSAVDPVTRWLIFLGQANMAWAVVGIPVGLVLLLTWGWYRRGRAAVSLAVSARDPARRLFGERRRIWIPSVRQAWRDGRMASFAESLCLMHEHQVPMGEALVLAADASGDVPLRHAAAEIARRLERGERTSRVEDLPPGMPPLLAWSVVWAGGGGNLSRVLAMSAEMYREQAAHAARWTAFYLPVVLTVVFGGSAVFAQAMVVFWPMSRLLLDLAR